ncbi:MAG: hypothetical protein IJR99_03315 [Kiritimatiellae bacterium]|nr:hypothetical protein [Kiritimatiellia bacterium]
MRLPQHIFHAETLRGGTRPVASVMRIRNARNIRFAQLNTLTQLTARRGLGETFGEAALLPLHSISMRSDKRVASPIGHSYYTLVYNFNLRRVV